MLVPSAIIIILFENEIATCFGLENGISGMALILAAIVGSVGLNMVFADKKRERRIENAKKYKFKKSEL